MEGKMAETENTWPFPDRPGVPLNPERDGWHWVEDTVDGIGTGHIEAVYYVACSAPAWYRAGNRAPIKNPKHWRYLGPCLTPAEVAAKDARIAELEDQLAALQRDASQETPVDDLADRLELLSAPVGLKAADHIRAQAAEIARLRAALGGKDE